jgi:hypothetical protein
MMELGLSEAIEPNRVMNHGATGSIAARHREVGTIQHRKQAQRWRFLVISHVIYVDTPLYVAYYSHRWRVFVFTVRLAFP